MLEQNFTDFEHIIVNDGSTDNTKTIIDDYAEKDPRIKPQHIQQNVGRAMARNTGMDDARGKYIFFLDSDDYLPQTAFNDLYKVAEKNHAEIVFGRFKAFDQSKEIWLANHYTDDIINKEIHKFRLDDHLALVNNHSIIGRLYRKAMIEKHRIRFSTVRRYAEDVTFSFYTAYYAESMSMVPDKIVYYYSIGNFLATANESKLFDARDNIFELLEFSMKNGSNALIKEMQKKAAFFVGDLRRAKKVYGLGNKFRNYLTTLTPLVKNISEETLNLLPPYPQNFTRAILVGDFDEAFTLTKKHNLMPSSPKFNLGEINKNELNSNLNELYEQIAELNTLNKELAHKLNSLYDTMSWRITAPVRKVFKMFFGKKEWNLKKNILPLSILKLASLFRFIK